MASIMVCNLEPAPSPGQPCPPEAIEYYQNFWDTGLTMAQTSELVGLVVLLWVVAYCWTVVRRVF